MRDFWTVKEWCRRAGVNPKHFDDLYYPPMTKTGWCIHVVEHPDDWRERVDAREKIDRSISDSVVGMIKRVFRVKK